MRAIWKGAVSFGLVSVPVRLYTATESHDTPFHQVRKTDGSRIRYRRVAEADGEEVAYGDIGKGYQAPDGRVVILTDEDLATLPVKASREIAVEKFVPSDEIDPLWLDKPYYLEPDKSAVKQYALLREALRESDRMAVVTLAMRSRLAMAVLRVRDDVIVLQTMLWPDEIRAGSFDILDDVPEPKPAEVAMANLLVESLAGEFDPSEFEDEYQIALDALVQAKLDGGEASVPTAPSEDDSGQVVDLLAALQKSVERAKAARGESTSGSGTPEAGSSAPRDSAGAASGDGKAAATSTAKSAAKSAAKAPVKTAAKAPTKTAAKAPATTASKTAAKAPAKRARGASTSAAVDTDSSAAGKTAQPRRAKAG